MSIIRDLYNDWRNDGPNGFLFWLVNGAIVLIAAIVLAAIWCPCHK